MKGPVSSHRDASLHQARVRIQQARELRLRWLRDRSEAMSIPDSSWHADLLAFAASYRDQAHDIPGRWWRMPSGLVFKLNGGFHGVMCIAIPTFRQRGLGKWYGTHETTVRVSKYRAFLSRCECLGDAEPTALLRAQIAELEAKGRWQPVPALRAESTQTPAAPAQMEMFA